jgi:hypothetical protein
VVLLHVLDGEQRETRDRGVPAMPGAPHLDRRNG